MNTHRVGIMSTVLAIAMISIMLTSVYAYGMWNFDTKRGEYTTADVGVAGNYSGGKLYSPAAYAKATVDKDLPAGTTLRLEYRFEWGDINHITHYQNGTVSSSGNKPGDWIRVDATGLPSVVYYIVSEGRAGYGYGSTITWDTEWASASLPWV